MKVDASEMDSGDDDARLDLATSSTPKRETRVPLPPIRAPHPGYPAGDAEVVADTSTAEPRDVDDVGAASRRRGIRRG